MNALYVNNTCSDVTRFHSVMSELQRRYGLSFIGFMDYKSHPILRGQVYVYELKTEVKE